MKSERDPFPDPAKSSGVRVVKSFRRSPEQLEKDVDKELERMALRGGEETTADRYARLSEPPPKVEGTVVEIRRFVRAMLLEGTCSKCGAKNVLTSKIDGKEMCYYGCDTTKRQDSEPPATLRAPSMKYDPAGLWKLLSDLVQEYMDEGGPNLASVAKEFIRRTSVNKATWQSMDDYDVSIRPKTAAKEAARQTVIEAGEGGWQSTDALAHLVDSAFELIGESLGIDWTTYREQKGPDKA